MAKDRPFTGVWIPAKIWESKKLTPIEKMFLAEVKTLSENTGWCFASNKHFAEWMQSSIQNISNHIARLKEKGCIIVTFTNEKTGDGRKIKVNQDWYLGLSNPLAEGEPPLTEGEPPLTEGEPPLTEGLTESEFKEPFKNDSSTSSEAEEFEEKKGDLVPPFTHVGTIEPAPPILARLYSPEHPDFSIVTSVPGTYTPNTEFRRVNIPEEIERLKTDPAAKETFALVRKIPSSLYSDYVEAFEKEIGGTGETYHNLPAFRKHFFNWCGSRYEIAQRKTNTPKTSRSQINHAGGNPDKYLEKQIF